jgi:endonuclease/exonuclease/phosphatase (EEP) superfamily protein YafD
VAQARRKERLVIAGGDFNSTPESAVQSRLRDRGLRDVWMECASGDGATYPADLPVKRIDYLYLTGDIRCASARVVETPASDHRPLLVELALPAALP